ncbi:MAG: 1-deoxy-D-xylulose-5-phosphate synthase [Planctomycetales bacterium 4484_113]|nr:MAG: 1-deoxy-D-xylulose-5-phosphate synthase [Planctomycetales bacterium 4484_113]
MGEGMLARISCPADLKRLPVKELPALAEEIRQFLLESVPRTGGHLASNLGVVELTLALHYVFDSPVDRLVFDTGHQGYVHKLLTGRRSAFSSLRQIDGISGFLRPEESPHDVYGAGHASTSVAAALGMNNADDSNWTVAIIGDGALSGGLALAALNNSYLARQRFLVVLNDNGMSIDPSVGTIARYLSAIKARPPARRLNQLLRRAIARLPGGRSTLRNIYNHLKDFFFYFFLPGDRGVVFEELGYSYFGPFDGHNVVGLVKFLRALKRIEDEPLLLHVITRKGRGYAPAERRPTRWHGISAGTPVGEEEGTVPRPQESGQRAVKSYAEVFVDTLIELARKHPELVAITAAMPSGTGLRKFAEVFPDRFYDVGISEDFAITFACGLAIAGKRPVCAIYSTFLQRAFDQLVHDAAIQELPLILAIDRGGIVGHDGETHQGIFDLSYVRMIPGFVMMAPKDEEELRRMLVTAVLYREGPVAIRYPRGSATGVELSAEPQPLHIGEWEELRSGGDVYILAVGSMVSEAMRAADRLKAEGIPVGVVNARFVKPLDEALLLRVLQRCRYVLTIEENVLSGGFGSAVLEFAMRLRGGRSARVEAIALPDSFVECGDQQELRCRYGLTADTLIGHIHSHLGKTSRELEVV